MDVERDDEVEPQGGWEWVKTQEEKRKKEREEVGVSANCDPSVSFQGVYTRYFRSSGSDKLRLFPTLSTLDCTSVRRVLEL